MRLIMSLLIDINCFPKVFGNSVDSAIYIPVAKSLNEGKMILIYGGTKYIRETNFLTKYHKIINNLKEN